MSAGEAELQEPRITFLATLPEVMRHIERLRIKNIIPGVVKRCHDWLDKDSSGNHVFTDLETNGEETLLFACAAFRGLIVDFGAAGRQELPDQRGGFPWAVWAI